MNYSNVYAKLVIGKENRIKSKENYYEKHHILPRCMGGTDDASNLVLLTAREHFIAHRLLSKIYPENIKLKLAVLFMSSAKKEGRKYKITSRTYQRLKSEASAARIIQASDDNTLQFIYKIKVPSSVVNTVRKLFKKQMKTKSFQRALNKYVANLIVANQLGLLLTYSRNNADKKQEGVSVPMLLKCERILGNFGYLSTEVDSVSPLAKRKRCKITPCVGMEALLHCTKPVMDMNIGVLEDAMGDSFRNLFNVDSMVPVGVGYRNELGEVEEYKILV